MNKFIGIGRWTKDLELTITNSGKEVVKGTIAIQDKFKKDHTDFLNVVMFGKTGVLAEQYTKKGSLVAIEGKVQTGKYQNKEGNTVYTFDIIADSVQFLDTKQKNEGQGVNTQQAQTQDNNPFKGSVEIENSDLPF
jgi:single-strand DNA-binding protein